MTCKIKTRTKECCSKLGTAKKLFLLGGTILLSAGLVSQLFAFDKEPNDTASKNLSVGGVQNRVQYLNTLIISGGTNGVRFQYDKDSKSVQALGSLNMQNLVVGKGNSSSPSSVVFGGTNNANNGENSFIAWGEWVRIDSSAQNVAVIASKGTNVNASNTVVMHGNNINATAGKNITVLNAENKTINGNYVTVLGDSSASADTTFVVGDNVVNGKSNTFVFNGKDGAFIPSQDSAFYANSKVAINTDNAKAHLDINGGAMIGIRGNLSVPNWNYEGTIARFARDGELGLCALDGKNNQRIPLSESARKFWLCTETHFVELPRNAVTNDTNRNLPEVWNQQTGRWQKGLWVYGSKNKKGHFLCADGFVPDNSDPIGKTGVECIPCEWAKSGDLNCGEKKKVEETTPSCPLGTTYDTTAKKCKWTRETPCIVSPGKQGTYSPNKTIEEFDGTKWVVKQKCQLTCPTGYLKKTDSATQTEYCEKTGKTLRVRFMYPNTERYTDYFKAMQLRPNITHRWTIANSTLKSATEELEIAGWSENEVRVNVWDPYLELTMPFTRTKDYLSFILAVGETLEAEHGTENIKLYDLTKTSSNRGPNDVYPRYRRCDTSVVECEHSYGGTVYLEGYLSKDEVGDADLIDLVYYFGFKPHIQVPTPSKESLPMLYSFDRFDPERDGLGSMPYGERDRYNRRKDDCWRGKFKIDAMPVHSNALDRFRSVECKTQTPISIYIKEVPIWGFKEIYFYTDEKLTKLAPRGVYDLNANYPWLSVLNPDLYDSGIRGVIVDSYWKVRAWMGEKSMGVVNKKYLIRSPW